MKKWEELPKELQLKEVREYYDALQLHQGGLLAKRIFDIIVSGILLVIVSVKNPTVKNMVEAFVKITRDYDKYSELADSNSKKLMREYDYQSLSERLEKVLDF